MALGSLWTVDGLVTLRPWQERLPAPRQGRARALALASMASGGGPADRAGPSILQHWKRLTGWIGNSGTRFGSAAFNKPRHRPLPHDLRPVLSPSHGEAASIRLPMPSSVRRWSRSGSAGDVDGRDNMPVPVDIHPDRLGQNRCGGARVDVEPCSSEVGSMASSPCLLPPDEDARRADPR